MINFIAINEHVIVNRRACWRWSSILILFVEISLFVRLWIENEF
jgi:hypothetical protein